MYIVDELIRQVTINCAERGLLLLRVRDEIRMTIAAYQTLYESSVAFGMRKALQAEQGKAEMERKVHVSFHSDHLKYDFDLTASLLAVDLFEARSTPTLNNSLESFKQVFLTKLRVFTSKSAIVFRSQSWSRTNVTLSDK